MFGCAAADVAAVLVKCVFAGIAAGVAAGIAAGVVDGVAADVAANVADIADTAGIRTGAAGVLQVSALIEQCEYRGPSTLCCVRQPADLPSLVSQTGVVGNTAPLTGFWVPAVYYVAEASSFEQACRWQVGSRSRSHASSRPIGSGVAGFKSEAQPGLCRRTCSPQVEPILPVALS